VSKKRNVRGLLSSAVEGAVKETFARWADTSDKNLSDPGEIFPQLDADKGRFAGIAAWLILVTPLI
jgi:hypothetical protein